MESDLAIFTSQMHNIKVRYHIVGKQEELQEIHDLYQAFKQKERPVMEEGEDADWDGNIILALGVDYGTSNLCGNIKECRLSENLLYIEADELALITDFHILLKNRFKDLEIYFATEDSENEMYVTNDAEGKYFPNLPNEHFIAPLDY